MEPSKPWSPETQQQIDKTLAMGETIMQDIAARHTQDEPVVRTDWQQMTTAERDAIANEIELRELARREEEREARKRRAIAIVNENRLWDIPKLMAFINKVNCAARYYGCLDKLPRQQFPSRQAFLEAAVVVLLEHGVPQSEIDEIFELDRELEATRTDAAPPPQPTPHSNA